MSKQKEIPDKMYFRIGETAELLDVKPYVLRYWETEFPDIKPVKSQSGQRLYKKRDVELLLMIRHLLYDEKFTINGAREHLKQSLKSQSKQDADSSGEATVMSVREAAASQKAAGLAAGDKKMLQQIKSDLKWCISELQK
jgi:DNA-binding transcriptional MerR regulator